MTCVCCGSCSSRNCVFSKFSAAVVTIDGEAGPKAKSQFLQDAIDGYSPCVYNYYDTWKAKMDEARGTYV